MILAATKGDRTFETRGLQYRTLIQQADLPTEAIWLGNITGHRSVLIGQCNKAPLNLGTRIIPEIGSSTTPITAVSTTDDAFCMWVLTPFRLVTRFRRLFAANVFAVFPNFLSTARLTDFLSAWVRFLETLAFVFRTIALRSLGHRYPGEE